MSFFFIVELKMVGHNFSCGNKTTTRRRTTSLTTNLFLFILSILFNMEREGRKDHTFFALKFSPKEVKSLEIKRHITFFLTIFVTILCLKVVPKLFCSLYTPEMYNSALCKDITLSFASLLRILKDF